MPCYSPLKGYADPETGGIKFTRKDTKATMEVACGQCLGCRLDRSRMWAARITHEASLHDETNGNSFITLTYRPIEECSTHELKNGLHIPEDWSLQKHHFQKFIKRLRKKYSSQKIKYYHCGEYGEICMHGINLQKVKCPICKLGRPHYHAALFNVTFTDLEPYAQDGETVRYTSPTLEKIWKYGFVDVGKLEYQSAAYIARYIMKKINGENAEEHYTRVDHTGEITKLQPEYSTMSNGIGKGWYEKYKADVFPSDETPVPGSNQIIKKVPRYYDELLKQENEHMLQEVKKKREIFKKQNADEYTSDRLQSKYKVKKAQTSQLSR